MEDAKRILKETVLFGGLSDKELDDVLSTARQWDYAAGETIVEEGDPGGRAFFVILKGKVDVIREGKLVARLEERNYFGEMALLLEDTARTANVVAVEDTTCLKITQWDFRAMLRTHPDMSASMMLELAQRLRDSGARLS